MISRLHSARKNQFLRLLVGSELKFVFHRNVHSSTFFKSLFRSIFEVSPFLTAEKSEVSSAKNLGFGAKFSDKSLIQIKTIVTQELNLGGLQLQPQPTRNIDRLIQPFGFCYLRNLLKCLKVHRIHRFALVCSEDLGAILNQMLSICLEIHTVLRSHYQMIYILRE